MRVETEKMGKWAASKEVNLKVRLTLLKENFNTFKSFGYFKYPN